MTEPSFSVVETFHSVQGEGAWMGSNAFFIRLGGCDVGCPWCDTKESWYAPRHPQRSLSDLVAEVAAVSPAIAIITGGEPLLHDLTDLSYALRNQGWRVHLETSGAHPFSGEFDWVTCSPKRFKPPHASVYSHINELKIVVTDREDLVWAEQQECAVPATALKYLQPEWGTLSSQALVVEYILQHPAWRMSLQTHKYLGVR
jgi:organic radical activating enzyme